MKFDAFIVGDITIEETKDLCASLISKAARKDISIFLSSEGGDIAGALSIGTAIQTIQRQGKQVHIHVGGIAQSAAVLVTQFANRRTMETYSSMLIHPAFYAARPATEGSDSLDISALQGMVDDLSYMEHCYFEVCERRTGFDVRQLLEQAHYRKTQVMLYPADCLKWNLIDEILPYALPECHQETRLPTDDSIGNVVSLASARQQEPPKEFFLPRRAGGARRKKA